MLKPHESPIPFFPACMLIVALLGVGAPDLAVAVPIFDTVSRGKLTTKIEGSAGTRWTYTASGMTTNLAARLAAQAGDGEIVISEATRTRLGCGRCSRVVVSLTARVTASRSHFRSTAHPSAIDSSAPSVAFPPAGSRPPRRG